MPADPQRSDDNIIAFRRRPDPPARPLPKADPEEDRWRVRSNIAALVFAALLVVVGLYLVRVLAEKSHLEDCLMSGRTNCAPIDVAPRAE